MSFATTYPGSRPALLAVATGGLLAAALDLIYICSFWAARGVGPMRILQSVAAGWLGRDAAIAGGNASALLGLVSHFGIAMVMAAAYYLAARRWPSLAQSPLRFGALYGIALYVAMNYVAVPLSAAGNGWPKSWSWADGSHLAAHMLLVGVPCALTARYALRENLLARRT